MSSPTELAAQAGAIIATATEATGLSLMELATVFRIAATICDETHNLNEKAIIANKIRGWKL